MVTTSYTPVLTLTIPQLIHYLTEQPENSQPVRIVTRTKVGGDCVRRRLRNGFIGCYPSGRRDITLLSRNVQRIAGNRHLLRHRGTGQFFLVFYPRNTVQSEYQTMDGQTLAGADVEQFIDDRPEPSVGDLIPLSDIVSITIAERICMIEPSRIAA